MKKYLLFALAASILAGCSRDDVNAPDNGEGNNDPVEIKLWTGLPVTKTTRGVGSVGDLAGDNNKWDNNVIQILSFPKMDSDYNVPFLNKAAIAASDNSVTWLGGGSEYYNSLGAYDFWGIHLDGAASITNRIVNEAEETIAIDVTIDGTQDIMIAKAELTEEQKAGMLQKAGIDDSADDAVKEAEWAKAYSAYAARRDVQPNMLFKHLLSRLKFNIYPARAGAENVYIKSITATSKTKGNVVFVAKDDTKRGLTIATDNNDPVALSLKQRPAAGTELEPLSERTYQPVPFDAGEPEQTAVPVGESLLLMPAQTYDLLIITEENMGDDLLPDWREATIKKTVSITNGFLAGYSYSIDIIIAGLEQLEVTASLQAWEDGGSIVIDPDDEF